MQWPVGDSTVARRCAPPAALTAAACTTPPTFSCVGRAPTRAVNSAIRCSSPHAASSIAQSLDDDDLIELFSPLVVCCCVKGGSKVMVVRSSDISRQPFLFVLLLLVTRISPWVSRPAVFLRRRFQDCSCSSSSSNQQNTGPSRFVDSPGAWKPKAPTYSQGTPTPHQDNTAQLAPSSTSNTGETPQTRRTRIRGRPLRQSPKDWTGKPGPASTAKSDRQANPAGCPSSPAALGSSPHSSTSSNKGLQAARPGSACNVGPAAANLAGGACLAWC